MTKENLKKANELVERIATYKEQLKSLSKNNIKYVSIGDKYKTIIGFQVCEGNEMLKPAFDAAISATIEFVRQRIEILEKQLDEL